LSELTQRGGVRPRSVKDLFDVKGFITKAGTQFMKFDEPAAKDCDVIARLREAGAVFIGHTNMTELAYSGLGLNPHYGTPVNALYADCIPGGSTSGGAISVACGAADVAIGTDTGGSLRIPAAFNGIVGFKPTQNSVSREGCKALSQSLDSVGTMAASVDACKLVYQAIAQSLREPIVDLQPEFIVPTNYGMDDLEPAVATGFSEAIEILRRQGFKVRYESLNTLHALKTLPVWQFSSIESRASYDEAYKTQREIMDPRVASATRMGRADEVSAIEYRKTLNSRNELITRFKNEIGTQVLLMPTVPILPPSFATMESDDEYNRINLQVLRNPSIANVLDCCCISLPFEHNKITTGVMLTASGGNDLELLALAAKVESYFKLPKANH
jgi:aspartyl-tRNA(Asn)/glutamyl-tRNA(Gln) amidotransferase subunit A